MLEQGYTHSLISEINKLYQTKINDLLLFALAQTIREWTQKKDVIIGLEGHGREYIRKEIDVSQTVGWFTTIYPVLLSLPSDSNLENGILSIKAQLSNIPRNGIGYGLLRYMHPSEEIREKMAQANFDILFNYLGQSDNVIDKETRFRAASESKGDPISGLFPMEHKITINSIISDGRLKASWNFSKELYSVETIEKLSSRFIQHLIILIDYCKARIENGEVSSAFKFGGKIKYEELDKIFDAADTEDGILEF